MRLINEWAALIVAAVFAVIGIVAVVMGNMLGVGWFVLAGIAIVIWPTVGDKHV